MRLHRLCRHLLPALTLALAAACAKLESAAPAQVSDDQAAGNTGSSAPLVVASAKPAPPPPSAPAPTPAMRVPPTTESPPPDVDAEKGRFAGDGGPRGGKDTGGYRYGPTTSGTAPRGPSHAELGNLLGKASQLGKRGVDDGLDFGAADIADKTVATGRKQVMQELQKELATLEVTEKKAAEVRLKEEVDRPVEHAADGRFKSKAWAPEEPERLAQPTTDEETGERLTTLKRREANKRERTAREPTDREASAREVFKNEKDANRAQGEAYGDEDEEVPAEQPALPALRHVRRHNRRPETFLPDQFYFENTYLGGDAGYRHSLRLLDAAWQDAGEPHRLATLPAQRFDPPAHDGLGLLAAMDRTSVDGPGRVFLQVGLRGSERFGWRRPPLELVVVLDTASLAGQNADLEALVSALLEKLGPQDRLAVLTTGADRPLAELDGLRHHRAELLPRLEAALAATPSGGSLAGALTRAGWIFAEASQHRTTAPGTQVALVVTRADADGMGSDVVPVVDQLTLGGIVTSVVGLSALPDTDDAGLWRLAAAGHGNAHSAVLGAPDTLGAAVDSELDLLARVVARLARVNVRLAPGVKAVRVLGSRPLEAAEVQVVKAREVETDRRLSAVLGIAADRGDDDDGIQTVIPVFYGGDSHVIILELWVEGPGPVADVTLRYKDMVNLDNRASRTSVSLRGSERRVGGDEGVVALNRDALEAGERLGRAALQLREGRMDLAAETLSESNSAAARRYAALLARIESGELTRSAVADSLELAARRAVGGGG